MSRKRTDKVKPDLLALKPDKNNVGIEENPSKITGPNIDDKCHAQSFDDYQCSGNLEIDFPELCALLEMKEIPAVRTHNMEGSQSQMGTTTLLPKPCLHIDQENEDPGNAKVLRVSGWKVDERIARVLHKTLPSLSNLERLHLWRTGLTDDMVVALSSTTSLCSNLRAVVLEGNPLPENSYHVLLSEDSLLSHLSLRNNRIGDEGARLIGCALSTARSANKSLVSLNLAFNSIGDVGAAHLAQGLRLNRALHILSLSSNNIGDAGAAHFSKILGPFALTHEEVVERRKLLLERDQSPSLEIGAEQEQLPSNPSSSSLSSNVSKGAGKGLPKKKETPKKDEKPTASYAGAAVKKEEPKAAKKSSEPKTPRGKGGKSGTKEKIPTVPKQEDKTSATINKLVDMVEIVCPLLEPSIQHIGGQVIVPGNTALKSLNLAGNRITEQSLPLFLSALQTQPEGGLLRLCLQKNGFPQDCESHISIQELMALRDPLKKTADQTEGEGQAI